MEKKIVKTTKETPSISTLNSIYTLDTFFKPKKTTIDVL